MSGEGIEITTTLSIPTRLIVEYRRIPSRIALYGLIGRLFVENLTEVPLTRYDVMAYDSTFSDGSFQRGVSSLQKYGWLVIKKTHVGRRKNTFIPTWGNSSTTLLTWNHGAKLRTCPAQIACVEVNVSLFDDFGGILIPSRMDLAHITRSNPDQALNLHDIGTYIGALAQVLGSTSRLEEVGLIKDGKAQPLPSVAIQQK